MSFESVPQLPKIETEEEPTNNFEAKEIALSGDFDYIESELRERNLLYKEVLRIKEEYETDLEGMDFLTSTDFEMLAILDLFDKDLARHSIATYKIAHNKTKKTLAFDIKLENLIEQEGVQSEEFFRACLFHDIGKVSLPEFIINNKTSNQEMSEILQQIIIEKPDVEVLEKMREKTGEDFSPRSREDLEFFLRDNRLRAVHLVPVRYFLSPEEQEVLESRGFDNNSSLLEIIENHERFSKEILANKNLEIESELAGSHHNYEGRDVTFPISVETLNLSVDMAELLRLADITEALTAVRSYKESLPLPKVFLILLGKIRSGEISPLMGYLWIEDEIKALKIKGLDNLSDTELDDLKLVEQEINKLQHFLQRNLFSPEDSGGILRRVA